MPRAAGNDTHYTWSLVRDPERKPETTDIRFPSVTTVIKTVFSGSFEPASKWGFKQGLRAAFPEIPEEEFELALQAAQESEHSPYEVREAARLRGTAAHDYFEFLAVDRNTPLVPFDGYQESIQKWWVTEMSGWEVIATEATLVSVKYAFAGTCDLIRRNPENLYEVLDLKTHSGSARYEDRLQVAAYELAAKGMGLIPPEAIVQHRVVLAREDGRKAGQSVKYTDPAEFLRVLEVYKQMRGGV